MAGAAIQLAYDERLLLSQRLVAVVFGVSPAAVCQWAIEPVRLNGRTKLYYLPDVVAWRERQRFDDGDRLDVDQESARRNHYAAEKLKREVELLDRETIRTDEAEQILGDLVVAAKTRLLGMGARLAPGLVSALKADAELVQLAAETIDAVVREALEELSKDAFRINDAAAE